MKWQGLVARELHSDAFEPWGYVAPTVAAVVTRATGVQHIYTIFHLFGGRRFACFGIDPASAMVQKQNTRNVYLRTDDKRCNYCVFQPVGRYVLLSLFPQVPLICLGSN